MTKAVLVLDGETDQALAVCRSLAEQKIAFDVVASSYSGPAFWCRKARHRFIFPSPIRFPREFCAEILQCIQNGNYETVFPLTDSSTTLLQDLRHQFPDLFWAMANPKGYQMASDKFFTQKTAASLGLSVPKTFYLQSETEFDDAAASISFPAVLKPRYSRLYDSKAQRFTLGDTKLVYDAASLKKAYRAMAEKQMECCIQEWVPGIGFGVELLIKGGQALAVFCHERIREMNPLGSGSSVCRSAQPRQDLIRASLELLRACQYEGAAMVEFRIDPVSGKSWFMEINGRFWGTLGLATACGVDFPMLYLKHFKGQTLPEKSYENFSYPEGVRYRCLWKDTMRLLLVLKGKPAEWNKPFPGRAEALKDYFGDFFYTHQLSDFRWSDPLPALVSTFAVVFSSLWALLSRPFMARSCAKGREE